MTDLLLVGATLIDGTGAAPVPDAVIKVEGGRIVAAGAREGSSLPDAKRVVDATGKFVIPGIVNANVHLLDGIMMMGRGGLEYLARFEGRLHEVIEEASQIALAAGMTTVFDTWNATQPVLYARDRVNAGTVEGARIFAAGNIVGMGGPFSVDFNKLAAQVASIPFVNRMNDLFEAGVGRRLAALTPDEVREKIRAYLEGGVDLLKVAISDHVMAEAFSPHLSFSRRVLEVMAEEAGRANVPLLSHTVSVEAMNEAIELGCDAMMHCTITSQVPIPDEMIERMISKKVWGEIQPVTDDYQCYLEKHNHPFTGYAGGVHRENTIRLIEAGAPILMGTDAGCTDPDILAEDSDEVLSMRPWTLGQDHLLWFEAMGSYGMKPMDMLQAATRNPAIAYRQDDLIGTLEAGKFADMLVLDGDPLADHRNYAKIHAIIKEGREIDFGQLPNPKVVTAYPRSEPRG